MSEKYITLKEASEISGYAPDYVGQLIRKGKLPGKQVYHVAIWMTTEHALRKYLDRSKSSATDTKRKRLSGNTSESTHIFFGFVGWFRELRQGFFNRLATELGLLKLLQVGFWIVIIFLAGFSLLLFYIFSVRFDKKLQERALEKIHQEGGVFQE